MQWLAAELWLSPSQRAHGAELPLFGRVTEIPVSDKQALILLVVSVGLTPSPLMSFEIRGAGSALSKHKRRRDEFKIHQRGVQWKQGVVVYIIL